MLTVKSFVEGDRWGLCLGLLLGLGLLAAGPSAFACCENAECAFETCCYADNTCMDTGGPGQYKKCHVTWHEPSQSWFCQAGNDGCTGEECDPL